MVVHEINHLQGFDISHWNISECNLVFDSHTENQFENLKAELEKYKPKIEKLKLENPKLFDFYGEKTRDFSDIGLEWREVSPEYPNIKPYQDKIKQFNIDFLMNMYDAANKDYRKQELKQKYFEKNNTKGRTSEEKFEKDFGFKK